MSAHVVVSHLAKRYGRHPALQDVSFSVERGEVFGLLGLNGAGKTTTLECLTGLREPDAGELTIAGVDARRRPREARRKLGVALQDTALPDQITPREALALFGSFYPQPTAPDALLARFGLVDKAGARFSTLSGGQRQRLALALVFVNQPEVVVLDEPSASLDALGRREMQDEILAMRAAGHTVLLSTHDLDEASRLCDRIAIIHQGRVVATGTPRELTGAASRRQTVTLVATAPLPSGRLTTLAGAEGLVQEGLVQEGATTRFRTADATRALGELAAVLAESGVDVVELQVKKASLEDLFLELTGAPPAARETGANAKGAT